MFHPVTKRFVLLAALLAPIAAAAGAAQTAPNKPQAKAPEWHILVLGDSQAQGLAAGLMRLYLRQPNVHVLDRSHIGTGLSRTNFDWPAEVKKLAAGHPDVAVVMFGANDRPNIRIHGAVNDKLAAKFAASYGAQILQVASILHDAKINTVWVGHPQVRDPVFNDDMKIVDALFAEKTAQAGVGYFPTWTLFAGSDGGYDAYGKGIDGETTRLRADDGVHMSRAGYDVLAHALEPKISPPASVAGRGS